MRWGRVDGGNGKIKAVGYVAVVHPCRLYRGHAGPTSLLSARWPRDVREREREAGVCVCADRASCPLARGLLFSDSITSAAPRDPDKLPGPCLLAARGFNRSTPSHVQQLGLPPRPLRNFIQTVIHLFIF